MSHITLKESENVDCQIKDIDALKRAAARCNGQFFEGARHFRTYADDNGGKLVGDWPLPKGYAGLADLQAGCRHAIGLPPRGDSEALRGLQAYQIGVVESQKYPGTYSLSYDFYGGALDRHFGQGLENLMMFYHAEAMRGVADATGDCYSEQILDDGTIIARIDTTGRMGV